MTAPRRWRMHPQPQPGESLSSWLARLARANASSLSSWLAAERGTFAPRADDDRRDAPALWSLLAERAAVEGGALAVRALTLLDVEATFGRRAASRWLLSTDRRGGRPKARWCPTCVAEDGEPYLRRFWRLEWVLWCPRDGARLRDACRACGAALDVQRVRWTDPLLSCWRCDGSLADGSPAADPCPGFVREAVREAIVELAPGSHGATAFGAVERLQAWIEHLDPVHQFEFFPPGVPPDVGVGAGDPQYPAVTFALAWHLIRSDRLSQLAARFQAAFNRATTDPCPPCLAPLRRPPDSAALRRERMRARLSLGQGRLRARGAQVSRPSLAFEAGVSVAAVEHFERDTQEVVASTSATPESLVAETVATLRRRGASATVASVRRELSKRGSVLEARRLRALVYAARRTTDSRTPSWGTSAADDR